MIHAEKRPTHDAIFLFVGGLLAGSWKLSLFSHRHKGRTQPQGDNGPDKEPSRVQADDDIDFLADRLGYRVGCEMVDKVGDQRLENDRITKKGEDVEEDDALVNVNTAENEQDARGHAGFGKSVYFGTILRKRSMSDMAEGLEREKKKVKEGGSLSVTSKE